VDADRLESIPLFADLPAADLALLAERAREVEVGVGTLLTEAGDLASKVFAVLEGTAVVSFDDRVIAMLSAGDVVGEIGAIGSGRRSAHVIAVTNMKLISLYAWDFRDLVERMPVLGERIEALIAKRIEEWDES
jgi:CRP-like cAMP-binding protein